MTEEKTLEEVLFDLLGRDFRIIFGNIQPVWPTDYEVDEPSIECVYVKFIKRDYVMERNIEKDHLALGLSFWADEFDKMLEVTV